MRLDLISFWMCAILPTAASTRSLISSGYLHIAGIIHRLDYAQLHNIVFEHFIGHLMERPNGFCLQHLDRKNRDRYDAYHRRYETPSNNI